KLRKKDRIESKLDSIKKSIKLTAEAGRLWQNVQHLPIRKGRELLKQHPIEAAEIDRVYGEIFEKLRPHREEHILTEEQYENLYQSQKEEIIEEVVTGDVDLFLYFLKFYGPRLLAEPRILSLSYKNGGWQKGKIKRPGEIYRKSVPPCQSIRGDQKN